MRTKEGGTKKFTNQKKVKIVKEAQANGIPATLAKYNVYRSTFDYWKKKYLVYGEHGLDHRRKSDLESENKKLAKENEQLKLLKFRQLK